MRETIFPHRLNSFRYYISCKFRNNGPNVKAVYCFWISSTVTIISTLPKANPVTGAEIHPLIPADPVIKSKPYSAGGYVINLNQPWDCKNLDLIGNNILGNTYAIMLWDGWASFIFFIINLIVKYMKKNDGQFLFLA